MVTKKYPPILIFLFLYLAIFPLGQMPRLIFNLIGFNLPLHLADLVILAGAMYILLQKKKVVLLPFVVIAFFSWLINIHAFGLHASLQGFAYLLRFGSYLLFFANLPQKISPKLLIAVGSIVAMLGIGQYFFLPDLRALYSIGWDDHYYRLASTFLDPAFAGILLVFSLLLVISQLFKQKSKWYIFLLFVNALALALTYSRASYLAFFAGVEYLLLGKFSLKTMTAVVISITVGLFLFLPRPAGEGVNLLRTYSIFAKWENFETGWQIFRASPLLGVGFNNVCVAKGTDTMSHACSGLDNSILFILATTGILGLITFTQFSIKILMKAKSRVFLASCIALFVHMQFTNTLFYPFVMGWIGVLWSISDRDS